MAIKVPRYQGNSCKSSRHLLVEAGWRLQPLWRKNTVRARIGPLQWRLDCLNHPVTVSQPAPSNTPSDDVQSLQGMPVSCLSPIWRAAAAFAIVVSSTGCILTSDLPNPALDVPPAYKFAGSAPERATP